MTKRRLVFALLVLLIAAGLGTYFSGRLRQSTLEIRIGCMIPLSGTPARQYGIWAQQGIDLAVDEVNRRGGINGHRLVIDYQDDQASAAQAARIMKDFAARNYAVALAYISSVSMAVAPLAEKNHVVLITNTYT